MPPRSNPLDRGMSLRVKSPRDESDRESSPEKPSAELPLFECPVQPPDEKSRGRVAGLVQRFDRQQQQQPAKTPTSPVTTKSPQRVLPPVEPAKPSFNLSREKAVTSSPPAHRREDEEFRVGPPTAVLSKNAIQAAAEAEAAREDLPDVASISRTAGPPVLRPRKHGGPSVTEVSSTRPALRMFVGTWNTEYGDFSVQSLAPRLARSCAPGPVSGIDVCSTVAEAAAPNELPSTSGNSEKNSSLTSSPGSPKRVGSRDAQFAALRERVRESLRIEDRLLAGVDSGSASASGSGSGVEPAEDTLPEELEEDDDEDDDPSQWQEKFYRKTHEAPTKKRVIAERQHKPAPVALEPLSHWLPAGYDIYVVSLQESVNDRLNEAILAYLNRSSGDRRPFSRMKYNEDKISGLGDGAYLSLKSTTVAVFVATDLIASSVVSSSGTGRKMSLSSLNGSKGAVGVTLKIYDQVYCFVSCHLPAGKDPAARRAARDAIRRQLATAYSGYPNVSPREIFHHIIWTGDFNSRVRGLSADEVIRCLYNGDLAGAAAFDEWSHAEFNADFADDGFEELPVSVFRPSYKLIVNRPPLEPNDPYRFHRCYNLKFKVRWYKGGKIKERVPSWTDRVFKWSHADLRHCLAFERGSYRAADPKYDSVFLLSDHAAVGCAFRVYAHSEGQLLPSILFVAADEET